MPKPRALIVHGGLELHQPRQGAEKVADMLSMSGMDVTVSDDANALVTRDVAQMALVVPVITGGTMPRDKITPLLDALRNGTGMAGYHHCMSTTFRDVPQFRYAAGCTWVAHPGNIMRYRVRVTRPNDPITAGIADFDHVSEQYYMHYDPAVEVLAETTFSGAHHPWRTNVVMPVTFKTHYGAGRIFFTALGHTADELDLANVRQMLHRGLLWSAGMSVEKSGFA
ncbi:ThuA domain-containing protein [Marinovum sp. 2_MG-2023]|uniref:ThuA domain-containing protein n=1 Tax=unclassified Marinovum TaxID=2647166 RepID=UPI0026E21937|nr:MULTISPECIES: ThuA domain-containing protein [unclassified Marinovum]MDO6731448.1 ThuA domain-containing protein [Marinovum sp. 2_MG-2023]MDO6780808.1 ThuA domain-containing protein [Marinovum sp. 1_MG-2023]